MTRTLLLTLSTTLLFTTLLTAQSAVSVSAENTKWLQALSEPTAFGIDMSVQEDGAQINEGNHAVAKMVYDPVTGQQVRYDRTKTFDRELALDHQIPAFVDLPVEQLSTTQVNQIATTYRLRKEYADALHWYGILTSRSDDPRHEYFYEYSLRQVKGTSVE